MPAEGRPDSRSAAVHRRPLQKINNHAGEIFSDSEWGQRGDGGGDKRLSAIAPHLEGRAGARAAGNISVLGSVCGVYGWIGGEWIQWAKWFTWG